MRRVWNSGLHSDLCQARALREAGVYHVLYTQGQILLQDQPAEILPPRLRDLRESASHPGLRYGDLLPSGSPR
jgi:hypothetical protein